MERSILHHFPHLYWMWIRKGLMSVSLDPHLSVMSWLWGLWPMCGVKVVWAWTWSSPGQASWRAPGCLASLAWADKNSALNRHRVQPSLSSRVWCTDHWAALWPVLQSIRTCLVSEHSSSLHHWDGWAWPGCLLIDLCDIAVIIGGTCLTVWYWELSRLVILKLKLFYSEG